MLSKAQKKELRSISHNEPTLVFIGKHGITETVLESFEISLNTHNLVKVGIQKASETTVAEAVEVITEQFSCELVSSIGRVMLFYRDNPKGRIRV